MGDKLSGRWSKEPGNDELLRLRRRVSELEAAFDQQQQLIEALGITRDGDRSAEAYRSLADNSRHGLAIYQDGRVVYANHSFETITGYSRREIYEATTEQVLALIHPEDRASVQNMLQQEVFAPSYSYRILHKDGSIRWVEIYVSAASYDGRPSIQVTYFDITERKRSQALFQVRTSLLEFAADHPLEQLLQEALDQVGALIDSPVGFLHLVEEDQKTMQLQAWSTHTEQICAVENENLHYPIDRAGVWVDCVAAGQAVIHNDYLGLPHRQGMPEGHVEVVRELIVPIMRDDKVVAILGVGNKPSDYTEEDVEVVTYLADVTWEIAVHKQAEQDLLQRESLMQSIFRAAPVGIGLVVDRVLLRVNDQVCKMLEYSADELIGKSARMVYPSDEEFEFVGREKYAQLESADIGTVETRWQRKSGDIIDVLLSSSPIDPADHSAGVTFTALDITDRKRAKRDKAKLEDQLRQVQRLEAIGRLAGGVAHDFNNLLTGIIGCAEMIQLAIDTDSPLRVDVDEIHAAAARAAGLTAQLLAFSRKQIIEPRVIQPNAILKNSQKMLRRLIGEDIELRFTPGEGLWQIRADPGQLDQILVNLAVNARDAMPAGGTLAIETHNVELAETSRRLGGQPGDYVMLAVADNGQGMDAEIVEHIFEPFYSTKQKGGGTGLGLSTVYGITKQNDGLIDVDSEQGSGTTFRIYFPAVMEKPEPIAAPASVARSATPKTVLLVEDEAFVRRSATKMLRQLGYQVIARASGDQAITFVRGHQGPIDLLLTDVVMPGMNGRDLHARLCEHRPDLKALYISGYTDDVIAHHGVLDEGIMFLQKPFSLAALSRRLREAFAES